MKKAKILALVTLVAVATGIWIALPENAEAHGPLWCCLDLNTCAMEGDTLFGELCAINGEYSYSCLALESFYDDCVQQFPCCTDL